MQFALGAEELFSLEDEGEYVSTLVSKCVDEYARVRKQNAIKISGAHLPIYSSSHARCAHEGQSESI